MMSYELMNVKMGLGGMEAKREMILRDAAKYEARANEEGYKFAPVCRLWEEINVVMGWTDTERCKITVKNMVEKGIIELSKNGKGYRMLNK